MLKTFSFRFVFSYPFFATPFLPPLPFRRRNAKGHKSSTSRTFFFLMITHTWFQFPRSYSFFFCSSRTEIYTAPFVVSTRVYRKRYYIIVHYVYLHVKRISLYTRPTGRTTQYSRRSSSNRVVSLVIHASYDWDDVRARRRRNGFRDRRTLSRHLGAARIPKGIESDAVAVIWMDRPVTPPPAPTIDIGGF